MYLQNMQGIYCYHAFIVNGNNNPILLFPTFFNPGMSV